jgi:type II secretory pathway pseudopilin PulG
MRSLIKNKSGQVWVETVIYTLIGLSVIGILLAVSTPKINEMKDRLRINEAIDILNQMDTKISEVQSAPSNQRVYDLIINKGKVTLDAVNDEIIWTIETNYKYSEPGTIFNVGDLKVITEGDGFYKINLTREYNADLTVNGEGSKVYVMESASIPYVLTIKSVGSSGSAIKVDISVK